MEGVFVICQLSIGSPPNTSIHIAPYKYSSSSIFSRSNQAKKKMSELTTAASPSILPISDSPPAMVSDDASSLLSTQTLAFSSGNPRIEETRGVMHFFSNDVDSSSSVKKLPVLILLSALKFRSIDDKLLLNVQFYGVEIHLP